jgi:hypothetical protein
MALRPMVSSDIIVNPIDVRPPDLPPEPALSVAVAMDTIRASPAGESMNDAQIWKTAISKVTQTQVFEAVQFAPGKPKKVQLKVGSMGLTIFEPR